MRKKGIALLITLFFISAISLIILKNLDDTNKFMEDVELDTQLTQLKITNNNIKDEVIKLIKKNYKDEETLEEILAVTRGGIPFNFANIDLFIKLKKYYFPSCGLNGIKTIEKLTEKCGESLVNKINYPYEFVDIVKKYDIKNQNQVEWVLDEYQNTTQDEDFTKVRKEFGYLLEDEQKGQYFECKYSFKQNITKANCSFVFSINKSGIVKTEFVRFSFKQR